MQQFRRQFPAIRRKFGDHFLDQPHVHCRSVGGAAGVVQFGGELFASREAAIYVESLQKIDDRVAPVEFLMMLGDEPVQYCGDIDALNGGAGRGEWGPPRAPKRGRPWRGPCGPRACLGRASPANWRLGRRGMEAPRAAGRASQARHGR